MPPVTVMMDRFVAMGRRNWEQKDVASKVMDVGLFRCINILIFIN